MGGVWCSPSDVFGVELRLGYRDLLRLLVDWWGRFGNRGKSSEGGGNKGGIFVFLREIFSYSQK